MKNIFPETLIKDLKEFYILENGSIKSKSLWYSSVCQLFPEFKEIFETHFNITILISDVLILRNIDNIPICKNPNCNNEVPLRNYVIGFQHCCCKQCIAEVQKTSLEFKQKCSNGAKNHHKKIHKDTFIDI